LRATAKAQKAADAIRHSRLEKNLAAAVAGVARSQQKLEKFDAAFRKQKKKIALRDEAIEILKSKLSAERDHQERRSAEQDLLTASVERLRASFLQKRARYQADLDARDARIAELHSKLTHHAAHFMPASDVADLRSAVNIAEETAARRLRELTAAQDVTGSLRLRLAELENENGTLRASSAQSATGAEIALERAQQLESTLVDLTAERDALQQRLSETQATSAIQQAQLQQAVATTEARVAALTASLEQATADSATLSDLRAQFAQLSAAYAAESKARRRLYNDLAELKGNIRVIARLRPVLPFERAGLARQLGVATDSADVDRALQPFNSHAGKPIPPISPAGDGMQLSDTSNVDRHKAPKVLPFDVALGPNRPNADLFSELSSLTISALDGFGVSILAFGATGGGKTHSILGPPSLASTISSDALASDPASGVAPRAYAALFDEIGRRSNHGWEYSVALSACEIYRDHVYDSLPLLPPSSAPGSPSDADASRMTPLPLRWRPQSSGTTPQVEIVGLSEHPVDSASQVMALLARALASRATSSTLLNVASSRSHLLLDLKIAGAHAPTKQRWQSHLMFVDLAGSERVKRSGATGVAFEEAIAINASLSALGGCMRALNQRSAAPGHHVPFRDHPLTAALSPALGTGCKVAFVVCVSPLPESFPESLATLTFGSGLRSIELGRARRNHEG
jgi:kinesin family protein C1